MDRAKYPIGPDFYELYEVVGQGVSASVYRARCVPLNETVAIKIIDFERHNSDLSSISREAQTMILVDHPNVLKAHCSFVSDHNLWVIMPFMAGGSCLHILKAAYPDGFGETVIATVLREVLKGLEYLHFHGHIHRDVKAGNILVGARGAIKLGDFGVSACLFDSGDRQRTRNTFVGTPCWMAPEVMEQLHGYDFKADIWSFGITALELAHGHAPFSKYPPMKVLLMTLQNAPPGLDYERDRKFSKSFKQMIAMCLVKDPLKRPSARKLLKHSFFKQARSNDYIARTLLEGLPTLGDRLKELKRKEEDMLAQKKMPDGKKEEISQSEYKRGISGWDFNIEDMKAQASLIQDVDETIYDKDQGGSTDSSFGFDMQEKQSQCQPTTTCDLWKDDIADKIVEDEDAPQNRSSLRPSADFTMNNVNRFDGSEYDLHVKGTNHVHRTSQDLQLQDDHIGNDLSENSELEISGRHLEGMNAHSHHKRGGSSSTHLPDPSLLRLNGESDTQQSQSQKMVGCNGTVVPEVTGDATSGTLSRSSKSSASNGEDVDDKGKMSIVQQRGRFKVTSVNVDLEKVLPTPMLQKSQSMQVITQPPATYDNLVNLTKQACLADIPASRAADGGRVSAAAIEKSLIDELREREKELKQEVAELRWSLKCAHEEIERLKLQNTQVQS